MRIPIAFQSNQPANHAASVRVLAGDIGGTKTDLAFFDFCAGSFSILKEARFRTKDFRNFDNMVSEFILGEQKPDIISLGVAGPVMDNRVIITNVSWELDGQTLSAQYDHVPVHLINDLEATAYGLGALTPLEIYSIYDPGKEASGNLALIAPGTGLGEAGLYHDGNTYHPFGTEGGHCDFSPRTALDYELYIYLNKQFGHVSWERVISGNGIVAIFDFLSGVKLHNIPDKLKELLKSSDKAKVITDNVKKYSICKKTINLFIQYLATEAGNLALKFKATGGVFICGGIVPKVLKHIDTAQFITHFRDFGRMNRLLADVPISVVLNERTALLGAAHFGASKISHDK